MTSLFLSIAEEGRQKVLVEKVIRWAAQGSYHDLVFQTTSLDFLHATQDIDREVAEAADTPKG